MLTRTRTACFALLATAALAACGSPAPPATGPKSAADPSAGKAHENYVEAINSNDLAKLLDVLTDDVVFMAPNAAPMVGKAAVKPWLEEYLKAYRTHWNKPVQEFVVNGEWAYERYSYESTDMPVAGGPAVEDTGWGLLLYHRDADGKWRVARDAWGSDRPAAAAAPAAAAPTPAK